MIRILIIIFYTSLGLNSLFGQRIIVRQSIEGFRGIGEVLAYSNSRILLKLNRDGEWPRQIKWEISDNNRTICAITFNKVGWQYTSNSDSCALDWMHLNQSSYKYRLYVFERVLGSPKTNFDTIIESAKYADKPSNENLSSAVKKSPINLPIQLLSPIKTTSTNDHDVPSSINTSDMNLNPNFPGSTDAGLTIEEPTILLSKTSKTFGESVLDSTHKSKEFSNKTGTKSINYNLKSLSLDSAHKSLYKSDVGLIINSEDSDIIRKDTIHTELNSIHLPISIGPSEHIEKSALSIDTTVVQNSKNESKDYNILRPTNNPYPRWFKGRTTSASKSNPVPSNAISTVDQQTIVQADSVEVAVDSVAEWESASVRNVLLYSTDQKAQSFSNYNQKAPFICVASFETLDYAKQVLHQFSCPGGCIIVRSNTGNYYRIGYYPELENISADLIQIRKKYSDAWLVKL